MTLIFGPEGKLFADEYTTLARPPPGPSAPVPQAAGRARVPRRMAKRSEKDTLEWRDHAQDNSRLTCQIVLTEALDGIVIRLPEPSV